MLVVPPVNGERDVIQRHGNDIWELTSATNDSVDPSCCATLRSISFMGLFSTPDKGLGVLPIVVRSDS